MSEERDDIAAVYSLLRRDGEHMLDSFDRILTRLTTAEQRAEHDRERAHATGVELLKAQAEVARLRLAVRDFFVYMDGAPISDFAALADPPTGENDGAD